jgi:hypothetical protein
MLTVHLGEASSYGGLLNGMMDSVLRFPEEVMTDKV